MITRRYKDGDGVIYERWFDGYKDVPPTIEIKCGCYWDACTVVEEAKLVFEAPAFQFRGEFSGATRKDLVVSEVDDGSYAEPGRFKDIENQRKHLEEKRDKERHDTLAEEFSKFDESVLNDPQIW